jgi:type I restriction enzyme R subunit
VIDIFAAAGLKNPDISILSDQFLAEVRGMKHKNLAVELLRKLLQRRVKPALEAQPRAGALVRRPAREVRAPLPEPRHRGRAGHRGADRARQGDARGRSRGEDLGLTDDELAFYDALEVNDSAVKVLGDETCCTIARELVDTVRKNVTIDWTVKESVRAKLRVIVKRILRKYGYPPDKQEAGDERRCSSSRPSSCWVSDFPICDRSVSALTSYPSPSPSYHHPPGQSLDTLTISSSSTGLATSIPR